MTTVSVTIAGDSRSFRAALIRTGLLVAAVDGMFASVVSVTVPPLSSPLRLFQGVASVLLGREALSGGLATGAIGVLMHIGVAFFWSGVFMLAIRSSDALRDSLRSWPRALAIAAVYGMSIWLIMSLVVIPSMVHRPPTIGPRYWVQLLGHIPFVAMPMVLANRHRPRIKSVDV